MLTPLRCLRDFATRSRIISLRFCCLMIRIRCLMLIAAAAMLDADAAAARYAFDDFLLRRR